MADNNLNLDQVTKIVEIGKSLSTVLGVEKGTKPSEVISNIKNVASDASKTINEIKQDIEHKDLNGIQEQLDALNAKLDKSNMKSADVKSAAKSVIEIASGVTKLVADVSTGNIDGAVNEVSNIIEDAKVTVSALEAAGAKFAAFYKSDIKPVLKEIKHDLLAARKAIHEKVEHVINKVEGAFGIHHHHHHKEAVDPALVAPLADETTGH
ncbi:MAG: hypothetical protein LW825_04910 [Candidatus Jidaibacter sp.]|jgi:hypothetical protein|nr:hypothetical protein [Candidatus Jidaibacter sp.]